jgi:hypothetical protein
MKYTIIVIYLLSHVFNITAIASIYNNNGSMHFFPESIKCDILNKSISKWKSISRWLVEYDILPTHNTSISYSVHEIIAVAKPGDLYHLGAHTTDKYHWSEDPYCQEYYIYKQKTCHRWPFSRSYSESIKYIGTELSGSITQDALLTILPNWPLTDYTMPFGGGGFLAIACEALQSTNYHLLDKEENISGEDCYRFVNKEIDQLWVAKTKGMAVMQRIYCNSNNKYIFNRIKTEILQQISPGLWLPKEFRIQRLRQDQINNNEVIESEYIVRISKCLLNNNVPESIFIPIHPAGSLMVDVSKQTKQTVMGGHDLLDNISILSVKYKRPKHNQYILNGRSIYILTGVFSGILTYILFKGLKYHRKAPK